MKKLLMLTLLLVSATIQAAPVSQQQALSKAKAFMATQGRKLINTPLRTRHFANAQQPGAALQEPFYVFNAEGGSGFVIVSGDDRIAPILGYSNSSRFDADDMPANMRLWLEATGNVIAGIQAMPQRADAPCFAPNHAAITPLIKTQWDQGSATATGYVYNTQCPSYNNKHCLTGCVATATAQIMYYYQWPQSQTTPIPAYTSNSTLGTLAELPATTFDWDNMLPTYDSSPTQQQVDAVAKLMRYCGQNAEMNYGTSGSSADTRIAVEGMVKHFDYDPYTWKKIYRQNFSIAQWDKLLYDELAEGRPVIYDGSSNSGGHAFICDGYDGNGLYHINWGWGGSHDGFFALHIANPYEDSTKEGYSIAQSMIVGLQPNTGVVPQPETPDDEVVTSSDIVATIYNKSFEDNTLSLQYINYNAEAYAFAFGIALLNADDSFTPLKLEDRFANYSELPTYYGFSVKYALSELGLKAGKHKVIPISREKNTTEWKRCNPLNFWIEVEVGADGSVQSVVFHPIVDFSLDGVEAISITDGNRTTIAYNITNNGDKFKGTLYATVVYNGDKDYPVDVETNLKTGDSANKQATFNFSGNGTYTLRLTSDWTGTSILDEKQIDIQANLKATDWNVTTNHVQKMLQNVELTIANNSNCEYSSNIYVFASKTTSMGSYIYRTATELEQGATETLDIAFVMAESGTYNFWATTDSEGKNIIGKTTITIKPMPTQPATLEANSITFTAGTETTLAFNVKNTGSVAFYDRINVYLYKDKEDGTGYYAWLQTLKTDQLELMSGQTEQFSFTFTDLVPGKNYMVYAFYYPTIGSNTAKELANTKKWFTVPALPTSIDSPTAEEPSQAVYHTLSGTRLNAKPSQPGVYIVNGRKILVK